LTAAARSIACTRPYPQAAASRARRVNSRRRGRVRFRLQRPDHAGGADHADRPRKIAHVNLNAREFDASLAFFTQALGFRLVDENAPLWFLHCANTDHCSIVLAKTGQPTLNHVAFERSTQ